MLKQSWSAIVLIVLVILTGCGSTGTPTRKNDFTPLTSIEISAVSPAIAQGTSTKLTANGNFSGLFTSDITSQVVWTSNNTDVADFIFKESPDHVTSKIAGVAVITATKGNVTATFNLTVTTATIAKLTISPDNPSVPNGRSFPFKVSGNFSDSTTQDMTFDAKWSSDTPGVATVSDVANSKGLATTLALGSTTITAAFGGQSTSTTLKVINPIVQSIAVTTDNPTVLSLSKPAFKAIGTFSNLSTADITSQVTWKSSQTNIATIDPASGAAKALAPGTTSISANLPANANQTGVSGTTNLKVTGGTLTAITLSPLNPLNTANPNILIQGTLARITATGTFDNRTTRDITGEVDWSVADTTIATVTVPSGNVAFVNALTRTTVATTTITAKSGTVTGVTNLTVTSPTLLSITIAPASQVLALNTSGRFTLTGAFNDNTTQDLTANADWTSSNKAIATVGNTTGNTDLSKGRVTGSAASAALVTISAGFGGLQPAKASVTVTQPTLQSLAISAPPASFVAGTQFAFTLKANFSDGTIHDVTEVATWKIDKANVAILADSQNQPGQVVAVDTGTATLTASFGGITITPAITLTVP